MSGIFPGARDLDEFWQNLRAGKDCITEIPKDRWDWKEYYGDPGKETNKTNIKWGGFIDGIAEFDPLFFGISPREAELMDPQQRLLMTYVWKAIEDAGYSGQSLSGTKTGIFIGTSASGYSGLIAQANIPIDGYSATGSVVSVGPNRMSYFLNIHGPSEPIETACSSSLVAIHRAVAAIETGSCEMAIVGGVNTILTPEGHISFNKTGMLCEDGRCKTFSNQANGYVRGEGVGMIFLKKLKEAEAAGDHIYGVIRGIAENHGGRANSLTAPNPKAQAELIKAAYTKAGIDPRTVSYIEAHGTGTELGDPIEINGLKTAFKEMYQATGASPLADNYCGLGSVKTNIGHLELAAGIAGVIKVLLQLKHQTLVKSLHCDTINPYIQLEDSPFYIVRETKEWQPLPDALGEVLPRRAGVSSFGFGGVNAHVVIEEYSDPRHLAVMPRRVMLQHAVSSHAIIVLSARNEDRLREQVRQLLAAIQTQPLTDANLDDLAYTLQVGREAMEERLAVLAGSIGELEQKLQEFMEGREGIIDLYRGQVKRNKETLAVLAADEEMAKTIDAWIGKGKYSKLIDLWVKGLVFDWNKMYGEARPRRISLPTYPFAREQYWLPDLEIKASTTFMNTLIHPLLHENTSDLTEQRYSTTFTGRENFVADHVVNGQRILPGVIYLEMARAAVAEATKTGAESLAGLRLQNVVWSQPMVVGEQPVRVHIGLYPVANGAIAYEVYGESEAGDGGPVIYSQGNAVFVPVAQSPILDLKVIQAQCSRIFTRTEVYGTFNALGVDYGQSYQGIEEIYVGEGQVLAKLSLATASAIAESYVLHPGIMDAALQAAIGLLKGVSNLKPYRPIALHELEVLGKCTAGMWALLRVNDSSKTGEKLPYLDIDLTDETGAVRIRLKGLEIQENEAVPVPVFVETGFQNGPIVNPGVTWPEEAYELMTFEEVWQEEAWHDMSHCLGGFKTSEDRDHGLFCFESGKSANNQGDTADIGSANQGRLY